jgi:hypothetical protein
LSDSSTENDIEVIELEERKCGVSAVQVTNKETTRDDMMMPCHAMYACMALLFQIPQTATEAACDEIN